MTHSELRDVVHLVGGAVGSSSWPSDQHLHDQVDDVAPLEPAITRLFWGLNGQQCVIIIIIMQERERMGIYFIYSSLYSLDWSSVSTRLTFCLNFLWFHRFMNIAQPYFISCVSMSMLVSLSLVCFGVSLISNSIHVCLSVCLLFMSYFVISLSLFLCLACVLSNHYIHSLVSPSSVSLHYGHFPSGRGTVPSRPDLFFLGIQ